MLVCQQIRGGLELVLGLHRDPEMGLVVMAGSGGVLLELIKDVAFCAPPVSRDKARDMLDRMRAGAADRGLSRQRAARRRRGRRCAGRARPPGGRPRDVIESVDINPFVALPQGGLALDALIVLRRR